MLLFRLLVYGFRATLIILLPQNFLHRGNGLSKNVTCFSYSAGIYCVDNHANKLPP